MALFVGGVGPAVVAAMVAQLARCVQALRLSHVCGAEALLVSLIVGVERALVAGDGALGRSGVCGMSARTDGVCCRENADFLVLVNVVDV